MNIAIIFRIRIIVANMKLIRRVTCLSAHAGRKMNSKSAGPQVVIGWNPDLVLLAVALLNSNNLAIVIPNSVFGTFYAIQAWFSPKHYIFCVLSR